MTRLKHQQPMSGNNLLGRSGSPMARSRSPKARAPLLPPVKELTFLPAPPGNGTVRNVPLAYKQQSLQVVITDCASPFEPSSMIEGASRLSLTLRLPKQWDSSVDCFESCLVHEIAERSQEFFGRSLPEEEVTALYKPISKKTGEYPRNLRVKVNTSGAYRTRYWAANKEEMAAPQSHAGLGFNARVAIRGLWFGEDAWGVVAECTDLQLTEEATVACPF